MVDEVIAIESALDATFDLSGDVADGTVATATGLTADNIGSRIVTKSFTLAAVSVVTTDHTTNGAEGHQKLIDLPAGNITILGVRGIINLLAGAGGLADTAAVVTALGTAVAAADATLTSTEANVVPSTIATLSAGAVTNVALLSTTPLGVPGATSIYLNFAVPDAGTSANDTIAVTGVIDITYLIAS
jgi:hypothetical protein